MRDPYEVLGVGQSASEGEIRTAFRRKAAKHHPDRNPDDQHAQERFKELNQAYQILSDAQKRAAWDRFGEAAFAPGGVGAGPGAGFVDIGLDGIFGDILGAFGFRGGDRNVIRKKLRVSFEEAAHGCEKPVSYDVMDGCSACRGSGAEPGTAIETCSACAGRGRVRFQQGILPIAVERPCSRCRGIGRVPTSPCSRCSGSGLVQVSRTRSVAIPPGIESGASRVVEGAGHRTRADGQPGNLEVVVEVEPHPFFKRNGDDVLCHVPITFAQAALGGEVEVPTLSGKVRLRVPPATQSGTVLRIRGKGIAHRVRGGHGDQLVEVSVEIPSALSERARELIEELAGELGEDVQPQQKTFVEKLKSLFG